MLHVSIEATFLLIFEKRAPRYPLSFHRSAIRLCRSPRIGLRLSLKRENKQQFEQIGYDDLELG